MAEIRRARKLRQTETWAEKLLWRWLRDRRFSGYKFRRQHPLGEYYLDFFCEAAELNIELDGGQHGFPDQQNTMLKERIFWPRAALKRSDFGIRIYAVMHNPGVILFLKNCKNARRIHCLDIRGRWREKKS